MLQSRILNQYMAINESPTIKRISDETGIQSTRVFRILNGSPMKLSEYEIFNSLIKAKSQMSKGLDDLILDCYLSLSVENIKEIESLIIRKLELNKIKKLNTEKRNYNLA